MNRAMLSPVRLQVRDDYCVKLLFAFEASFSQYPVDRWQWNAQRPGQTALHLSKNTVLCTLNLQEKPQRAQQSFIPARFPTKHGSLRTRIPSCGGRHIERGDKHCKVR